MSPPTPLDAKWREANPLPDCAVGTDKNSRGRVLLVGGSRFVPGALRLTGEAALRAGAGKVQLATVAEAATSLGVLFPEAAMLALASDPDGEIALEAGDALGEAIQHCDTLLLGPGMSAREHTADMVAALLDKPRPDLSIVLDAAAVTCCREDIVRSHGGRFVMTPHHGEMAALSGLSEARVADDAGAIAADIAERFGAVVALKGGETFIAAPGGGLLHYDSDCFGLATSGSGDVLAGIIGGLLARGASPIVAAGWGVWLHGEAGRACAAAIGPLGFLARDLLAEIPRLMAGR